MKIRSVNLLTLGLLFFLTVSASAATFTVTKVADTNDGVCDSDCSLREAIAAANADPGDDMIIFDEGVFGVQQTITLSGSEIVINNAGAITITGPGAKLLKISGNNVSRIFRNTPGAVTSISRITLTEGNGASTVVSFSGGAILNDAGNLNALQNDHYEQRDLEFRRRNSE